MNPLLLRVPFTLDCDLTPAEAAKRVRQALNPPPEQHPPRWRVRGKADERQVHLFFSWRRWSNALAPHLDARWVTEAGRTRLVGEFRQRPVTTAMTLWSGVALAAALAYLSLRHGLPWSYTVIGGCALVGYPRIAWFITDHHMTRIEEFLRGTLEAAPPDN